mgnify:CR=1 FL=1
MLTLLLLSRRHSRLTLQSCSLIIQLHLIPRERLLLLWLRLPPLPLPRFGHLLLLLWLHWWHSLQQALQAPGRLPLPLKGHRL